METLRKSPIRSMRIVSTIAMKDLVDALRNKTIISGMVTVLFLISLYHLFPRLYTAERINVVVFDQGNSALAAVMEDNPGFRLYRADSEQQLRDMMGEGDAGELGFLIPSTADEQLAAGQSLEIQGYVMWGSRQKGQELQATMETELAALLGRPVEIEIADTVYPRTTAMGAVRTMALSLVIAIFFSGVLTVPHLILEEKGRKTLETLLVSPASAGQIVAAKALAGTVICLLMTALAVVFSWSFVVNWGVILIATAVGTVFAVSLGLALGAFLETKQQSNGWMLLLSNLLLVPAFLSSVDPILPEGIRAVLPWTPMVAQVLLFRYGFSSDMSAGQLFTALSVTTASALVVLGIVGWKVHRSSH